MKVFLYSCRKKKLQEEKLKRSKEAGREIYLRSLMSTVSEYYPKMGVSFESGGIDLYSFRHNVSVLAWKKADKGFVVSGKLKLWFFHYFVLQS